MADGESPAAGAATPSQPRSSSLRDVIVNFYLEHNPSKVGSVEGILQQYKGQESLLLAQLREKYGKDPLQDADGTRTSEDHPRPMSLPPLSSIINEPPLERRVAPVAGGDAVIKVDTSRTGATGAAIRDRGSLSYEALRTKFDAVSTDCNNLAAKVALLEKQRQTSCVRQKALEEKFVELRCERDDAVQKCERKHVQLLEALDEQYNLQSQLSLLLTHWKGQEGAQGSKQSPLQRGSTELAGDSVSLESARLTAQLELMGRLESEALLRRQVQEADSIRQKYEKLKSENQDWKTKALEAEKEGQLMFTELECLRLQAAVAREKEMQLGEQLLLAEQKLQEAQSARTALLSFCQQEKDRIAAQAADSLQSVKAELAKAEAERLSKEREIESRALMSADLRLQASEEEIRRLSRALLQSRADCAKAEKQSGDLRRELSKAADALAELKVCNERHPAAPSDLSFS